MAGYSVDQFEIGNLIKDLNTRDENPDYEVPPNLQDCENFRSATATGWVDPQNPGLREKCSLEFMNNQPFKMSDSYKKFAQMSTGYSTYFLFILFAAALTAGPFLISSIFFMIQNSMGNDCRSEAELGKWEPILMEMRDRHAGSLEFKQMFLPAPGQTAVLQRYVIASCVISYQSEACQDLYNLGCFSNMSSTCTSKALKIYQDRYGRNMCRKNALTVVSSANNVEYYTSGASFFDNIRKPIYVAVIVIALVMLFFFHKHHADSSVMLDIVNPSLDDCSVHVKGIPKSCPDIKKYVTQAFTDIGYEPVSVELCYDVEEFIALKVKFHQLTSQRAVKKYLNRLHPHDTDKLEEVALLISSYDQQIEAIEKKIKEKEAQYEAGTASQFIGEAFVSLSTVQNKISLLSKYQSSGWLISFYNKCFKKTQDYQLKMVDDAGVSHVLSVSQAPPPADIIWQNLGYSSLSTTLRSMTSKFLSLIIVFLDLMLIYALKVWGMNLIFRNQASRTATTQLYIGISINLMVSVAIFMVDFGLQFLLNMMADFEKPRTITEKHLRTSQKVWKVQFLTSGLVPLLISLNMHNFYGPGGLYSTVNIIFLTNIVLTPFVSVLGNPWMYFKWYKRRGIENALKQGKECPVTQGDANNVFVKEDFRIWMKYSAILKNTSLAFFYMPMVPMTAIYLLVFLALMYYTDKFALITISNKLTKYTGYISKRLIVDLELCLLAFAIGILVNELLIDLALLEPIQINWFSIAIVSFLFVSYWFELLSWLQRLVIFYSKSQAYTPKVNDYMSIVAVNPLDYEIANPATSVIGRNNNITSFHAANLGLHKLPLATLIDAYVAGEIGQIFGKDGLEGLLETQPGLTDKSELKPKSEPTPRQNGGYIELNSL